MTIKKLLISNRGEIASRIIKSAHDMGITCVAFIQRLIKILLTLERQISPLNFQIHI